MFISKIKNYFCIRYRPCLLFKILCIADYLLMYASHRINVTMINAAIQYFIASMLIDSPRVQCIYVLRSRCMRLFFLLCLFTYLYSTMRLACACVYVFIRHSFSSLFLCIMNGMHVQCSYTQIHIILHIHIRT